MANVFGNNLIHSVNGKYGKVQVIEDKNEVFEQVAPSDEWVINHTLDKKVSVTVTDTAGTVVEGTITVNNKNKVIIQFNFPFSGEAVLN
jgi:hypothetical protein